MSVEFRDIILPLQTAQATLETVGGKGANLARLARAGYPVPDGFLVTTDASRGYVVANKLQERILTTVTAIQPDDPIGLRAASQLIRGWFSEGILSPEVASALQDAYSSLGQPPAAVRSSATAEDLPDMSFAGQQDTFLNVISKDALLQAVVQCWSSLWTARAIGYRARNGIPHEDVTLAVVVQEMVPAEASGVLFTANPLTGVRTQAVIDATWGLGEALVSGQVEPDHYVVDTPRGEILSKTLGAKAIAVRAAEDGGVVTTQEDAHERQALPDHQILRLAEMGQHIAAEFSFPQDIEWAWAGGQLTLLQSRPITALFPLPEGSEPDPLRVFASFAAVQGFVDPMTPLGQDAIRMLFAGAGDLFGLQETYQSQQVIRVAGERLWIELTAVVRNRLGRKIASRFLDLAEPTIGQALATLWADPRVMPERPGVRKQTLRRVARVLFPLWRNVLRSWRDPDRRRAQLQQQMEGRIATLQAQSDAIAGSRDRLRRQVAFMRELRDAFPFVIPEVFSAVIGGLLPLAMLNRLVRHLPQLDREGVELVWQLARGLPHNVTTEMDLALWDTACAIRAHAASALRFREASAPELAADYLSTRLPHPAQEAISRFMGRYGMRGPGEIDLGQPRWREAPTPIMQLLQSYLDIEDQDQAPGTMFHEGAEVARATSVRLETAIRDTRGGRLKARVVRWTSHRFRALAGLRESPKFYIVRMMGILRQGLLQSGQDLVKTGVLDQPDDIFFLHLSELEALALGESRKWHEIITERRQTYIGEKRRSQIPRLLLSDGHAFYEGLSSPDEDGENTIVGSPVSPGTVEGPVRVVLDPHSAQLAPGDILVCPGTDPAWTPLFLAAGGLIMELGGMMTHGSVVAREYGIPAVVGVHDATRRLQTGQRIRLDGNTGQILLLEP